jgi:hypothetical protein
VREAIVSEDYEVQDGDDVASIAHERGFAWKTLWDDPGNAGLKEKRKDPGILKAGDVLHIPDRRLKEESAATEQAHKFKAHGSPPKLRLRIMDVPKPDTEPAEEDADRNDEARVEDPDYDPKSVEEKPLANCPYVAEIDGKLIRGSTDGDGMAEIPLPPRARKGRLILHGGTPQERVIPLNLGAMDPISEWTGVRKRLLNLGFACREEGDALTADLERALLRFQEANGLDMSGKADDATRAKLKDVHGC